MRNLEIDVDWGAFVAGDQRVFECVYDTFFDPLYNYGRNYTDEEELVEDAIQELFVRFWKNRANLTMPASLRNYLFKAFRNHLRDRIKASGRYVTADFDERYPFEVVISAEETRIASEMDEAMRTRLTKAMEQLTARQKEAIFLRFYEGFSYEEIAHTMEITVKATYKLMARSIEAMRHEMGGSKTSVLLIILRTLDFNSGHKNGKR
ncbi:MAG: sigma-70 family RNA polymerase sigma factor [Parapedobacter sp.]|nr:MAG: sigma-70 family RNA polymerase sigma factor [Parapedobacter sp.]